MPYPGDAGLKKFVIDTSRNGQGPWTPTTSYPDPQDWCNPPDRGLGVWPTANTGIALLDAYLWVKIPGESDGECTRGRGPGGTTVDPEWGLIDPAAGQWFPKMALDLVHNANPPLARRVLCCIGLAKVYNKSILLTDFTIKESIMKKLPRVIRVIFLLAFFITACGPVTPAPTQAPASTIAPLPTPLSDAQQYLSDALDIIQNNALNTDKVNWPKVRTIAFMFENNAKTPADTYDSIRFALQQLGDHHSSFMTPDAANQMNNSTIYNYPQPQGKLLENKIGYVAVFEFNAQLEDEANKYADKIQSIIIELDMQSVCGWIVDLRDDLGGNMYPMIAGLGALIGEGELGLFKDAKGNNSTWYYRNGQSWFGNVPLAKVSHPEFLLDPDETPVAVLIGPQTASSGEATAISFRGRPNTYFFGKPSYGLTTGNDSFTLSDGAIIILTTVVELDRTGQEYGGSIIPDVVTSNPESEATDWLLTQPACKK